MKALARSYVYWPHLDAQLEELARSCSKCALAAKSPRKAELHCWPDPGKPWSRLHADYAGPINGNNFLILIDAYSKWPEVLHMPTTTASATITALRQVFSRFGYPDTLVTDNGTQFTAAVFEDFCNKNGITHTRSPPYHPQSNGLAERFVDTFKRALLKAKGEGPTAEILETFLFAYRITPNPQVPEGKSPAEALMQRKLRSSLDLLKPSDRSSLNRNRNMEQHFNRRHGAQNRVFVKGQPVLARDYRNNHVTWTPGRVIRRTGSVTYDVAVNSEVWVRHANQLQPRSFPDASPTRSKLPLDILLDTFRISPADSTPEGETSLPTLLPELAPRRCSTRRRKSVIPMQVNPKLKSYAIHSKGGDVRGRRP